MKKLLVLLLVPLFLIAYGPWPASSLFASASPASASGAGLNKLCDLLLVPPEPIPPLTRQNEWFNPSFCQFAKKVFGTNTDEIFGERYTYAQVVWVINSVGAYIANAIFGLSPLTAQAPAENRLAQQGLSGAMGGAIAFMQTNQISLIGSLSSFLDKFNIALPVHAQGFGYGTLQGSIQYLWTVSRNASYFVMIILLLVAGFMVMFRVRVNPQTAVTIQMMIPKIIIALIGITFSYAIAGFIIDMTYVLLVFFLNAVNSFGGAVFFKDFGESVRFFTSGSIFNLWSYYSSMNAGMGILLGFLIPIAGIFIIPILLAILMFKILIAVARAYVMLLVHIITGPFQIMAGLVPTSGSGFGSWFRNVVGHAAAFLVVSLLFFLSVLFINSGPGGGIMSWLSSGGVDPQLNTIWAGSGGTQQLPQVPLFGGASTLFSNEILAAIIGYVILLVMPTAIEQTIKAFKAFSFGSISDLDLPLATSAIMAQRGTAAAQNAPQFIQDRYNQARQAAGGAARRLGWGGGGPPVSAAQGGSGAAPAAPPPPRPVSPAGGCLSPHTLIATPEGEIKLNLLTAGTKIWSQDRSGQKITCHVLKISKTLVPPSHQMVRLVLADKRELSASPTHPLITGSTVGQLQVGDSYDNSTVTQITPVPYEYANTYDLLTDSETGWYFANQIPLASTLSHSQSTP